MAVKKLSQIAPAGGAPALTDQVVGVTTGTTDNLYTLGQIKSAVDGLTINTTPISGGTTGKFLVDNAGVVAEADAHFPEATSNLDFYVATTGSDSNPGTVSQPFATIQRALTEAARYNWVFVYGPRIHIADGTYPRSATGAIQIGQFVNLFESIGFIANNANPQNVVLADAFELFAPGVGIGIGGLSFTGVTTGSCVNIVSGTISVNNPLIFNDNQTPFYLEGPAFLFVSTTLTVNSSRFNWFSYSNPGVSWFSHTTINLPAALTIDVAFFEVDGQVGNSNVGVAQLILGAPSWTNFNGVTGTQLISYQFGFVQTQNGEISDIPGTINNGFQDATAFLTSFGVKSGTFLSSKSGLPTISDVPIGYWKIIKDTSGGGVYLSANDGGVLKKVALV